MSLTARAAAGESTQCPLCHAPERVPFLEEPGRRYLHCDVCDLIFVHASDLPTRAEEAQRYLAHQNDRGDPGYVAFLRRLADPLCERVPLRAVGIDVGCGPAPVLSELLSTTGRPTRYYDPQFFPDRAPLRETYDFVTCCEVVEHAHDPAVLFTQLVGLLRPHGVLGVMTSLRDPHAEFARWWYRRDTTHVCFYSMRTLQWVAEHFDMTLSVPASNVALFTLLRGPGVDTA